jgi:hypothetical protein
MVPSDLFPNHGMTEQSNPPEVGEEIVLSNSTSNDGIYYKRWNVPEELADGLNACQHALRQQNYSGLSDPIINNISIIRDRPTDVEDSNDEKLSMDGAIADLLA